MTSTIYQTEPLIQTVDHVVTAEECNVALSHRHDYSLAAIILNRTASEVHTDVRNNQQIIYDNAAFTAEIFARVKQFLPDTLNGWQLDGLNDRFRFY